MKLVVFHVVVFFWLLLLLEQNDAASTITKTTTAEPVGLRHLEIKKLIEPYSMLVNSTICQMYSRYCKFVLRPSSKEARRHHHTQPWSPLNWTIVNGAPRVLQFVGSVVQRNASLLDGEQGELYNFFAAAVVGDEANGVDDDDDDDTEHNYEYYVVTVRPLLVGKGVIYATKDPTRSIMTLNYSSNISSSGGAALKCTASTCDAYYIVVTRPDRLIDKIQIVYTVIFSLIIALFMGLLLDMHIIIQILKMPCPVIIGFTCQYLLMPILAFAFIKIFRLPPMEALTLFIYGCSPGGSSSNNWTILFDGDIDLSAIMTFVSTISSLFMMPLWLYSVGRTLFANAEITIPFLKLLLNLISTIIPCLTGLVLAKTFPKLKVLVNKIAKAFILFVIFSFLLLTMYTKSYVFKMITWQQWVAAPLIPWAGFALSGLIAWMFRLPKKQIYTISIETGLQNVSIAFLIVTLTFPSPESDFAILPLICVTTLTNAPLWMLLIVQTSWRKYVLLRKKRRKSAAEKNNVDTDDENQEQDRLMSMNSNKTETKELPHGKEPEIIPMKQKN